jgi:DNA-binding Lrp family transcriptional regulator
VHYPGKLTESQGVSQSRNQEKMAEMVRLITQRGPRIDEIARDIGVYKETVRYWFRAMIKNGFTVQASCNYEKLGMKRVVGVVELGDAFKEYADAVFYVMGQLAYVIGFAKTQPEGYHVLNSSVPQECLSSWTDFMLSLKTIGIFKSVETVTFDWVRNTPMWAEYFNFDTGSWEFDWRNKQINPMSVDVVPSQRQRYDATDLKIIEQLQLDANTPLTEICAKVGASNYKTLAWHYRSHVFNEGLIKGFRVNWTGTKYDFNAERLVHKKHRYLWIDLIAKDISDDERINMMGTLNRTPFVWLEAGGARAYFARMVFPAEEMPEALDLLERAVYPVRENVSWHHMDQAHALSFTLPRQYYDEDKHQWNFNSDELLHNFETLVQKVKQGMS